MAATKAELAAAETLQRWKRDPVQMCLEEFNFEPDTWQARALRAFAHSYAKPEDKQYQRICLSASVGPGKSLAEAIMGWNFMACYSDGLNHPQAAAMSIDGANLKANLWKELAKWRDRSPFLTAAFEMNSDVIYERNNPLTWRLEARTWPKKADIQSQGRTLSGLHAKSILYLIDEVGDIHPAVLLAAEQGLSNCTFGKIICAGNPSSHAGILYFIVKEQPDMWYIIRVNGDPENPERSPRIDIGWAREMIKKYGRDNPWVMYAILGLFPPTSANALFSPDEISDAMKRHVSRDQYEWSQCRIGVDVARFGDDRTILSARQGLHAARKPVEMRNARTEDITARLLLAKQKIGSELELIDDTGGWSAGVQDACRLAGVNLYPINFSGKADDPRYFNKRSEMIFRAAEWVKAGGCLYESPTLSREMCAHTYYFHEGKMRVIEKDQVKALLNGHSPDEFDAFILTFGLVDMPAETPGAALAVGGGMFEHRKHTSEWDPNADA